MNHVGFEFLVVLAVLTVGAIGYGVFLYFQSRKYKKQLHEELKSMSAKELEDIVQRTGYLLTNHGDLLSGSSALYYRIRYNLAKKMLSEKQKKV